MPVVRAKPDIIIFHSPVDHYSSIDTIHLFVEKKTGEEDEEAQALSDPEASSATKPLRESRSEKRVSDDLSAFTDLTKQECLAWLSKKSFDHLQAKVNMEYSESDALCQTIRDTEETFIKDVNKYLAHTDMLNLRKKELLYKKWTECVYNPQQQKLNAITNQGIERRRAPILQYLDYCNKMEPVLLEDYNPDDYNPYVLHMCKPQYLKVKDSLLKNPMHFQSQSRLEEDSVLLQCQTGKVYTLQEINETQKAKSSLIPLCRENIDPSFWPKIPLGYIDSEVRIRVWESEEDEWGI
uniref:Protein FAM228B n=1 Tax=Callorhinchus milii TaxID=7868 RepID=A0A4W3I1D4_CALMI